MRRILGKFLAIAAVMCIISSISFTKERFKIIFLESKLLGGTLHQLLAPIHVAFRLSSNNPAFLFEFEVALKSVLLNAPLKRDWFVHMLADQ